MHGFRFYDLIFPLFIFLSGVTQGIFNKSLRGLPMAQRKPVYIKAVKRLFILVAWASSTTTVAAPAFPPT